MIVLLDRGIAVNTDLVRKITRPPMNGRSYVHYGLDDYDFINVPFEQLLAMLPGLVQVGPDVAVNPGHVRRVSYDLARGTTVLHYGPGNAQREHVYSPFEQVLDMLNTAARTVELALA